jgi:hypothetical protein
MKKKFSLFIIMYFVISFNCINAQDRIDNVKDILNNPVAFDREVVKVSGLVTQYIDASEKTTAYFLLKDDFGAIIRVNTADSKPETNTKYAVRGIVYIDQATQMPFISEKSRTKIGGVNEKLIYTAPEPVKTWWEQNWLIVVIAGSGVLLLILIIALLSRRKSVESPKSVQSNSKSFSASAEKTIGTPKENLKTMVIPAPSQKTMKFIPGELEIITGEDKGKIFKISGYPTDDGSTVTIGRETVAGPRDYAHLELKERTISRKQAEIIYKDGKLYIKNLSETNYTKLDSKDLPPNTSLELKSGSILTFGEVEMKYKI